MSMTRNNELLTLLLDRAPTGIITTESGRVSSINNKAVAMTGLNPKTVCGQPIAVLPDWLTAIVSSQEDLQIVSGEPGKPLQVSLRVQGRVQACFLQECSEIQQLLDKIDSLEQQLSTLETRDERSRLLNLNGIKQVLESQTARSRRYGNDLSILTMNIAEGSISPELQEAVYESLGFLFNDRLRWVDSVGHLDHDEFVIVLPETNADAATALKDKLINELAEIPLANSDIVVALSFTVGVASWQEGDDSEHFLQRAQADRGKLG